MAEQARQTQQQTPQDQNRAMAELAKAQQEAEERQADEAPEGGRFIVDGQLVDAEGNPINERDRD